MDGPCLCTLGSCRTGQGFPCHPIPISAPSPHCAPADCGDGGGRCSSTQALVPQLCEGLAMGVEAVRQGHPAQPQPPPGEGSWAGWPAARAAPEKSCCKKDMKPRHCESGR